ncbi:twin-arginine translocase subunit TatC [Flaviaesturariibacter aridisoli]|uniref:Sec-independent protein translocase protein TatC n=1 Tax=Flaviaesturariibacter aridisoli TaxID=2545761 RepID=A0A4R4E010_9BACT|nr:twin-arginine translocase subunit TatC [Flaviaesturariibacter aridisoli]TCZ67074.1 twin-arginine translocase subunit TatC [Flaviaesturariibacter aridisoli]
MALLNLFKRGGDPNRSEMSFIEHLDVLRGTLFRSVIAALVGAIVVGIFNRFFIHDVLLGPTHAEFPTYGILCRIGEALHVGKSLCMEGLSIKMQSTGVSTQFSMFFTVCFIGGVIIAFPYIFFEFWRFVRPALTEKERSNTGGVIFWVSVLFFIGVAFGYFVIAPYTIKFFASFQLDDNIENRWTVASYIDTMIPLVLGSGLAFQMPLVIYFLAKVGVVNATYLRKVRKYSIIIIFIIAAIITPGPDIVSQLTVALPLLLLYEVSILLARRVDKHKKPKEWS